MKKAGILLCGALAGVMFVGLGGCGPAPSACNILVENAKTVFEIGEEFSLSEDMQVKLLFTDNQTMKIGETADLVHDPESKTYASETFVVDYSEYDSTKGNDCPIWITYLDRDADQSNNLKIYMYVQVQREANDWVKNPKLSQEWTWGETPTFTPGQADFLNDTAEYYYKLKTAETYIKINNPQTVEQELKALDAGEYHFKAVYPQTDTIEMLDKVLNFKINRLALDQAVVPTLAPVVYSGDKTLPAVPQSQYYSVSYSANSNFVDAGVHYVTLTLTDTNYKWADSDDIAKNIEFAITPTTNVWTSSILDMQSIGTQKGWVKGTFDQAQFVAPTAQFGNVLYQIKLQNQPDSAYNTIAIDQLVFMEAGEYTLKAYIPNSNNYSSVEAITINFVVQPA